jgi:hypothetical protein
MGRKRREAKGREGEAPLAVPEPIVRAARPLYDQQMWCWGRDALHAGGNLLVGYGFERRPRPAATLGTSGYFLPGPHGPAVALWSFGVAAGEPGAPSLFLARFELVPREAPELAALADDWTPHTLQAQAPPPAAARPWASRLLARLCAQIAAYERWVVAQEGLEHRRQAVAGWKRPVGEGGDLPARWDALTEAFANWGRADDRHAGA